MHNVILSRCRELAQYTEEPGFTTRTFLSPPMHGVHAAVGAWMRQAGMEVSIDAVGNIRGLYSGVNANAKKLIIGSHLDTVPRAGAYDGILGVLMGIALVGALQGRRMRYAIEVIGFSEEEGIRYGVPFIGSRALAGTLDAALIEKITPAIREFGLDATKLKDAQASGNILGYVEFHIEQGPVLESMNQPLGVVVAIKGQSRFEIEFLGQANHAGTTPMDMRSDALAAAAEVIVFVSRFTQGMGGLTCTVGKIHVEPNASNVIPGLARISVDIRHDEDAMRETFQQLVQDEAAEIAARRSVKVSCTKLLEQPTVFMDEEFTARMAVAAPHAVHMTSGAGHDAMILAPHMPAAMLFLRSPGGLSHHPAEHVLPEDAAAAFEAGRRFLEILERLEVSHG